MSGATIKIFDFETPDSKEGELRRMQPITTDLETIGRKLITNVNDTAISSEVIKVQVLEDGSIVAYGKKNAPWTLNDRVPSEELQLIEPNPFVVPPESKGKLVQWLMDPELADQKKKIQPHSGRRLVFEFTNNNKAPKKDDELLVEQDQETPLTLEEIQTKQNSMLYDIKFLKNVASKELKFADKHEKMKNDFINIGLRQEAATAKADKLQQIMLTKDEEVTIQFKNTQKNLSELESDFNDYKQTTKETLRTLRDNINKLEEQNQKIQKSHDDLLSTVQSMQEENKKFMQMLQVMKAPALVEQVGDKKDSSITATPAEDRINETQTDTEDETDDPATLLGNNDIDQDDQTAHYNPLAYEQEMKDQEAQIVNQTMQSEDEKDKLVAEEPEDPELDQKTCIVNQTMQSEDEKDKLTAEESPAKKTGEDLKNAISEIVFAFFDNIGSGYAEVSFKALWTHVASNLHGYSVDSSDDKNELRKTINAAFDKWVQQYLQTHEQTGRPMDDSDEKEEQPGPKKQKKSEIKLTIKKPEETVEQSPISMFRQDAWNQEVLTQWAYDASRAIEDLGKTPTYTGVYAYIMKNQWKLAKTELPDFKLEEYEKAAKDWNTTHKAAREEAAKKRAQNRAAKKQDEE